MQSLAEHPRKFPKLDVQLKCTSSYELNESAFNYALEAKNYKKLQGTEYDNARILIVVCVPREVEYWLQQSEEQLIVRHCGYWVSLRNAPETSNTKRVTVSVPRRQQFTVEALQSIMGQIGNGEYP